MACCLMSADPSGVLQVQPGAALRAPHAASLPIARAGDPDGVAGKAAAEGGRFVFPPGTQSPGGPQEVLRHTLLRL